MTPTLRVGIFAGVATVVNVSFGLIATVSIAASIAAMAPQDAGVFGWAAVPVVYSVIVLGPGVVAGLVALGLIER